MIMKNKQSKIIATQCNFIIEDPPYIFFFSSTPKLLHAKELYLKAQFDFKRFSKF
jgi:hypothetical protein